MVFSLHREQRRLCAFFRQFYLHLSSEVHACVACVVRIRITRSPTEPSVDEIPLTPFKVGVVYSVPVPLATLMIVEGWAEPILEAIEPALPPVTFNVIPVRERRRRLYTDSYLRTHLGVAADRRRRR